MKKRIALLILAVVCLIGVCVIAASADGEPATAIPGHNLALEDCVNIIYYVSFENVPEKAETGVLVWTSAQDSYVYGKEEAKLSANGTYNQYDKFFFGVAAKMMSQDIYAVSYIKNGDEITYSALDKYSVLQYAYNKKGSTTTFTGSTITLGEFLADMLNYGTSAQKLYGYNTDRLANATYYQITVEGGTLPDGTTKGLYPVDSQVTLTATVENFDYWINEAGESLWTTNPVIVSVTKNESYTVVEKTDSAKTSYLRVNSLGATDDTGDYILFGMYPQTEVTDTELKAALTAKTGELPTEENSGNWVPDTCYHRQSASVHTDMWYQDVSEDGETYRGIYFTSYRSKSSNQESNGYLTNSIYWFKFEPLKWKIISESDGIAFLLCNSIIDSQCYYRYTTSNNYASSDIRAWLNSVFYQTAFHDLQKSLILTTTVSNGSWTTTWYKSQYNYGYNTYACDDTQDKIFPLSLYEVSNYDAYSISYPNPPTPYATAKGSLDYSWWLRSPWYGGSTHARTVSSEGVGYNQSVTEEAVGVVPALKIQLN